MPVLARLRWQNLMRGIYMLGVPPLPLPDNQPLIGLRDGPGDFAVNPDAVVTASFYVDRLNSSGGAAVFSWSVVGTGLSPLMATDFVGDTYPSGTNVTIPAGATGYVISFGLKAASRPTVDEVADLILTPGDGVVVNPLKRRKQIKSLRSTSGGEASFAFTAQHFVAQLGDVALSSVKFNDDDSITVKAGTDNATTHNAAIISKRTLPKDYELNFLYTRRDAVSPIDTRGIFAQIKLAILGGHGAPLSVPDWTPAQYRVTGQDPVSDGTYGTQTDGIRASLDTQTTGTGSDQVRLRPYTGGATGAVITSAPNPGPMAFAKDVPARVTFRKIGNTVTVLKDGDVNSAVSWNDDQIGQLGLAGYLGVRAGNGRWFDIGPVPGIPVLKDLTVGGTTPTPSPTPSPTPTPGTVLEMLGLDWNKKNVGTQAQLDAARAARKPGDLILLAPGVSYDLNGDWGGGLMGRPIRVMGLDVYNALAANQIASLTALGSKINANLSILSANFQLWGVDFGNKWCAIQAPDVWICRIRQIGGTRGGDGQFIVEETGKRFRVGHLEIGNTPGAGFGVKANALDGRLFNFYFHDFNGVGNGHQLIGVCYSNGQTDIEMNFQAERGRFVNMLTTNGENECIANKSSKNVYKDLYGKNCKHFNNRHGDNTIFERCLVDGAGSAILLTDHNCRAINCAGQNGAQLWVSAGSIAADRWPQDKPADKSAWPAAESAQVDNPFFPGGISIGAQQNNSGFIAPAIGTRIYGDRGSAFEYHNHSDTQVALAQRVEYIKPREWLVTETSWNSPWMGGPT